MPKVIYLTGAPAAGKTSLTRMLLERMPDVLVWEYGARLTEHIRLKNPEVAGQEELRSQSSGLITPQDVAEVDEALLRYVRDHRTCNHVLIDSHAVTKEAYGYRITPFSLKQFAVLEPDEIWVLYASPEETRRRIEHDAGGRPLVSEDEARMHTILQASVAATYGMSLGSSVYMFDTGVAREELVECLARRLA